MEIKKGIRFILNDSTFEIVEVKVYLSSLISKVVVKVFLVNLDTGEDDLIDGDVLASEFDGGNVIRK